MNILLLSTSQNSHATQCLIKASISRGHKVTIIDPVKSYLFISNIETGYDRLYYGYGNNVIRVNIKDFDCVIPRLGENTVYGAFIVEHLNKNLGIFSTASAEAIRTVSNKLKTLQICSSYGLTTPRTAYAQNPSHIEYLIEKVGGYPIIVKLLHGSGGTGVTLLKERSSAIPTIQSLFKSKSHIILQEYIPSGGKDYRVIVIGNKVVASYQRTAKKGDFRANLQLGGYGIPVTLNNADKDFCIRAARAVNIDVAGVDIIKASGKTYLIEINANFGFKVQKITGINIARVIIQYCEQNYHKKDWGKVQSLAYENLLIKEKKMNEHLIKQMNATKMQFGIFNDDIYINKIFMKAKGKKIAYKDRNNKNKQVTVRSLQDIQRIMIDSFIVN